MSIFKLTYSLESLLNKEEITAKLNNIDKKLSYATLLGDITTFDISFSENEFCLKQKPFYEDFKQRRALINEVHGKIYQFADKSKIVLRFDYSNMALIILVLFRFVWVMFSGYHSSSTDKRRITDGRKAVVRYGAGLERSVVYRAH